MMQGYRWGGRVSGVSISWDFFMHLTFILFLRLLLVACSCLFPFVVLFLFIFLLGLFFWCRREVETRFPWALLVDFKHRPG